ncbi:MAG: Na/Pi cotransporter family protein [Peptococcaceae bacterium]|nr:Na/Pi cotransporter family protein [Peptococcaceae bacterium]
MNVLIFLGGLGLFLYGVRVTSTGLQNFAAQKLRSVLQSITKRTIVAVFFGMLMTVAFQSSAATTVLAVEFVNTGMLSLAQALGIVLGSALGTSITIQLLAFQMLPIALGILFVGYMMFLAAKTQRLKHLGNGFIGFGLIFVGMSCMATASEPLSKIPEVYYFLGNLGKYPVLSVLVGILMTAVIQSSPAMFAIMMTLAASQVLTLEAIIPLVLGAHTGGTVTTLFSGITAPKMDARRTAIANTGTKVLGTILIWPFLSQFTHLVAWTTSDVQRQVANAHLLFSLLMVVVFLPFNSLFAKMLVKIFPDRIKREDVLVFQYIDTASLKVPAVGLKQVRQETVALGKFILKEMVESLPLATTSAKQAELFHLERKEESVDWYYKHITEFTVELNKQGLTEEQLEESIHTQFVLKELECIADNIEQMNELAQKLEHRLDWNNVKDIYEKVRERFELMLQSLERWDEELAGRVIREHPEIVRLKQSLQFNIYAMVFSRKEEEENANGYNEYNEEQDRHSRVIDMIVLFHSIDEHMVNIAQVIMGIV